MKNLEIPACFTINYNFTCLLNHTSDVLGNFSE